MLADAVGSGALWRPVCVPGGKMVPGNPGANTSVWLKSAADSSARSSRRAGRTTSSPAVEVSTAADTSRPGGHAGGDHEVWWAMQTAAIPGNQAREREALASPPPNRQTGQGDRRPSSSRRHALAGPHAPSGAANTPLAAPDRRRCDGRSSGAADRWRGGPPTGGVVRVPARRTAPADRHSRHRCPARVAL
jgi:hypothetical protein